MGKPALLIIDVQYDFLPGGALAVPEGDKVVSVLREYARRFQAEGLPVFASRDWHPENTHHFKAYGGLWPPHCLQNSHGAEFAEGLELPEETIIISEGDDLDLQGYSTFEGKDKNGLTFEESLKQRGVDHIYAGGLATDYCVRVSVLDALAQGFKVTLLLDAIRGIDVESGDSQRAIDEMITAGAKTAELSTFDIGLVRSKS